MVSGISSFGIQTSYMQRASRAPSAEEMFARMDTNGDGKIDKSELETMLQQAPPTGGARPAPPTPGTGQDATQLIDRFDKDGDGALNSDEATQMGETLRAEMEAMMLRMIQQSQQLSLSSQESDKENSSDQYFTAALQTYATQTASTLSESLFNTLG
jgi:Ca2+-binding EF-hand superfamily protein